MADLPLHLFPVQQADGRFLLGLLQYTRKFAASANIKPNTKDSYRLMCKYMAAYGDILACISQNTLLMQLCV